MPPSLRAFAPLHSPITTIRAILGLVIALAVCFGAAGLGAIATSQSVGDWYVTLQKPPIVPPGWVFPVVWNVLYAMMAVAAWLVWRRAGFAGRGGLALGLFLAQLVLNVLWSYLFFALQRPWLAAVEIVVLWAAILATVIACWRVRPLAGALLLPYLAWVSFAIVLNVWIAAIN